MGTNSSGLFEELEPVESPKSSLSPRLFHATGARVTSQAEWIEIKTKSVLNQVHGMSFKWSINPYRGCQHACPWCYARRTHWFLDQDGVEDWAKRIYVKVNAPEILRRELADQSWEREGVHIGTATDPYQPAEGTYRLTRQILEALSDFRTPATIVTRSSMIIRDCDVLRRLADGPGVMVCFSVATMDPALAREMEPNAPPPLRRMEALRSLREASIPAGIFLAPVLPGITDHPDQLSAVVEAAKTYGASSVWTNALHLGDVTRQSFFKYLEHRRPELVPQYTKLYRGKYAPLEYRHRVQEVVATLKERVGFRPPSAPRRPDPPEPPCPLSEQLPLL